MLFIAPQAMYKHGKFNFLEFRQFREFNQEENEEEKMMGSWNDVLWNWKCQVNYRNICVIGGRKRYRKHFEWKSLCLSHVKPANIHIWLNIVVGMFYDKVEKIQCRSTTVVHSFTVSIHSSVWFLRICTICAHGGNLFCVQGLNAVANGTAQKMCINVQNTGSCGGKTILQWG